MRATDSKSRLRRTTPSPPEPPERRVPLPRRDESPGTPEVWEPGLTNCATRRVLKMCPACGLGKFVDEACVCGHEEPTS